MVRPSSKTSQSLFIVLLLLTSVSVGMVQSSNSDITSRSTGQESITSDVLSDFYQRGSNISLTVNAGSLDSNTEYILEYSLCNVQAQWNEELDEYEFDCTDSYSLLDGSVDIGSGNMFYLSMLSILDTNDFDNGTMMFEVVLLGFDTLSNSTVEFASVYSNPFVLGGSAEQFKELNHEDILLGMNYGFQPFWLLEFLNYELLTFTTHCDLVNSTGVTMDSDNLTWVGGYDLVDPYFSLFSNQSGIHHLDCELIRDADGSSLVTMIGDNFTIIEANYTANESLSIEPINSYFTRTSPTTYEVNMTDLYIGQEYTLEYELCDSFYEYDEYEEDYFYRCESGVVLSYANSPEQENTIVEGSLTFTALDSYHVETISIDIDCCGDWEMNETTGTSFRTSIENGSYALNGFLTIQGVELVHEQSDDFILGGELVQSVLNPHRVSLLIGMDLAFSTHWHLDHENSYVLDYTMTCELSDSTGVIDNKSTTMNRRASFDEDTYFSPELSGEYTVTCILVRDADSTVMGSVTHTNISVLDADYTGIERVESATADTLYYDGGDTVLLTVNTSGLYVGSQYKVDAVLCKLTTQYDASLPSGPGAISYDTYCYEDAWVNSESVSEEMIIADAVFTPSAASHSQVLTIELPVCCGVEFGALQNGSMAFTAELSLLDVHLHEAEGSHFVVGGEVVEILVEGNQDEVMVNMNIEGFIQWFFDFENVFILDIRTDCSLLDFNTSIIYSVQSTVFDHNGPANLDYSFAPIDVGEYTVSCTLTREIDNTLMATYFSEKISVIADPGNQDDANMNVTRTLHPGGWGEISMMFTLLDAGQMYSVDWAVSGLASSNESVEDIDDTNDTEDTDDHSSGAFSATNSNPAQTMILDSGSWQWVEGTDSTEEVMLEFTSLVASANACFSAEFYAGESLLQWTDMNNSELCWIQNSTSDGDSDGVFDPVDQCPTTPLGSVVQSNGCSDSDLDGWPDLVEMECGTLMNDASSIPMDFDDDGICDTMDEDDDGDGFIDEYETLRGTDPYDATDFPLNQLPTCAIHYTLEADGMPEEVTGVAAISELVIGTSTVQGLGTGISPEITVPAGSYYIIAVCVDPDNDPITITMNSFDSMMEQDRVVTVGPIMGQVNAGAMVTVGSDTNETIKVTITWGDQNNSATTEVLISMEGDSAAPLPGFTASMGLLALLGALTFSRKTGRDLEHVANFDSQ